LKNAKHNLFVSVSVSFTFVFIIFGCLFMHLTPLWRRHRCRTQKGYLTEKLLQYPMTGKCKMPSSWKRSCSKKKKRWKWKM